MVRQDGHRWCAARWHRSSSVCDVNVEEDTPTHTHTHTEANASTAIKRMIVDVHQYSRSMAAGGVGTKRRKAASCVERGRRSVWECSTRQAPNGTCEIGTCAPRRSGVHAPARETHAPSPAVSCSPLRPAERFATRFRGQGRGGRELPHASAEAVGAEPHAGGILLVYFFVFEGVRCARLLTRTDTRTRTHIQALSTRSNAERLKTRREAERPTVYDRSRGKMR